MHAYFVPNKIPILTVQYTSLKTIYGETCPTNLITYDGDGSITVTSGNPNIASVSLSDKTITITPGSQYGTTTVEVSVPDTEVYQGKTVTFTVTNKFRPTISIGNGTQANGENTMTFPYTYNGNGTLTVSTSDSSVGTATINTTNKTITLTALSIGNINLKLTASETDKYITVNTTKNIGIGDVANSNSEGFKSALTKWGKIGTATDANWYGSTTDSHIYSPDGSFVILESVNTNNYTGYYYINEDGTVPSYKTIVLDVDMTTTNGDDDAMGLMIRFNKESTANYWTGYMLFLDRHDNGGGIGNGAANGLWRANNKQFSDTGLRSNSTKLVTNASIIWTRNKWQHYRFQAKDNRITVWRWNTNTSGIYEATDSAIIFDYTDTSSSAVTSGTYGFWCFSQAYAQFKNMVAVTSDGSSNGFKITVTS